MRRLNMRGASFCLGSGARRPARGQSANGWARRRLAPTGKKVAVIGAARPGSARRLSRAARAPRHHSRRSRKLRNAVTAAAVPPTSRQYSAGTRRHRKPGVESPQPEVRRQACSTSSRSRTHLRPRHDRNVEGDDRRRSARNRRTSGTRCIRTGRAANRRTSWWWPSPAVETPLSTRRTASAGWVAT